MPEVGSGRTAEAARGPRLLRDEVFRARVLPEWYRPAPGMSPLSPGALTALSLLLIAAFVLALATITHERTQDANVAKVGPATEPVEVEVTRKRSLLGWLLSSLQRKDDGA